MWVRARCWAGVMWVGVGESGVINSGSGIVRMASVCAWCALKGDGWLWWGLWLKGRARGAS